MAPSPVGFGWAKGVRRGCSCEQGTKTNVQSGATAVLEVMMAVLVALTLLAMVLCIVLELAK